MGTKLSPGEFDVYGALLPDEPYFVLAARDPSAPEMLRIWSRHRRDRVLEESGNHPFTEKQESDLRKCTASDAVADDMVIWRKANDGRWRQDASELRHRRGEATEGEKGEVADALVKAVGAMLNIPSVFRSSRLFVTEHTSRPWASPNFNGERHVITVSGHPGKNEFGEAAGRRIDVGNMGVQGQIVADVEIVEMLADSAIIHVLTVYGE